MGYTTDFRGEIAITPALTEEQTNYINTFSSTRRMKRDVTKLKELYNGEHGLDGEYGAEGEFFARNDGDFGQGNDGSVLDHNKAPKSQPGLWCQWEITDNGSVLQWDDGEKFYNYVEWLKYLIDRFFKTWGCELNGSIDWRGEDWDDCGTIHVENNILSTRT